MPRYDVILRNGGERGAEYDSGAASVVAGDEIEIERELWRVESVDAREIPSGLSVCSRLARLSVRAP